MKQIFKDKIINIDNNIEDKKFLFEVYENINGNTSPQPSVLKERELEVIFLSDFLEKIKNQDMIEKAKQKPAMWEQVFSRKDELKIFENLFNDALKNNKKIHIIGITLKKEVEILEKYYFEKGFFSEEINAFKVDFSKVLVTASVNIENLIYRGSNYKALGEKIFFNPPIRESGQTKAMFKGINRGVIANIFIKNFDDSVKNFLQEQITQEHILPITMAKVLNYNLEQIGIKGNKKDLIINY